MKRAILPLSLAIFLIGCSSNSSLVAPTKDVLTYKTSSKKITKKYKKKNKKSLKNYTSIGIASYYGPRWHGRTTANGEKLNIYAMTAAHKTLPFNTLVKVTDLESGKSVIVRINDRGPYIPGRIIDLTDYAAKKLGILKKGITKVKIEVIG